MTPDIPITGAHRVEASRSRTPAEWYCLLAGAALLALGALGFLVNATFDGAALGLDFDDGEFINGDLILGLEVNGWHNIVHLASGLVLLLAAFARASAKSIALALGLVYVAVTVVGFVDGNDVLGLIPVNTVGNVVHAAIAGLGLLVALVSPADDRPSATR